MVPGDVVQDYEKLEHVGDGLMGQCANAHSSLSRLKLARRRGGDSPSA